MQFIITEDWLEQYQVDINDFMDALIEMGFDPDPEWGDDGLFWAFEADDLNNDGIPDFLADLAHDPGSTNPSIGGDGG